MTHTQTKTLEGSGHGGCCTRLSGLSAGVVSPERMAKKHLPIARARLKVCLSCQVCPPLGQPTCVVVQNSASPATRRTYEKSGAGSKNRALHLLLVENQVFGRRTWCCFLKPKPKTVQSPYKGSTPPVFSVCFLKPRFLLRKPGDVFGVVSGLKLALELGEVRSRRSRRPQSPGRREARPPGGR